MNILIISHEYPPIGGGGANACMFLAKEFSSYGHSVTILTAKYKKQESYTVTREGIQIYRVTCLRKKVSSSNFIEMLSFLVSAWYKSHALVKEKAYDLSLIFFGIPSGPLGLYLKKKYGIPYAIRSGGGDIPGTQKRFFLLYKLLSPCLRLIWKESFAVITNSMGLRERAASFESRYCLTVIENGVDTTFFTPPFTNQTHEGTINILFVSRLIERKGLQYIIPKLIYIRDEIKSICNKNILLTVVGDGPYREKLEQLAQECDCKDMILFAGQQKKEDLLPFYQNADLFILPSKWEGMPNVVLEAMACGLPIIMTPCEGSKELVTDNGYITDVFDMPDKIIYLATHQDLLAEMGKNSYHNVLKKYAWSNTATKYLQLFSDFLKSRQE